VELFTQGLDNPGAVAGQVAVNLAFALLDAKEPQQAATVLEKCVREKLLPDKMAEVHFYLAGARVLAEQTDQALAAARQAARLKPDSPRILSREAWVLLQAERLDAARAKYLEILDRFDRDHDAPATREALRDVRLALSAIDVERGELQAAEQWLLQILDEFPEDIGAFNDLGYLWCDQGKHLKRSLRMVRKAVEAEPENVAYLDSLGWALYRLKRYDEAVVYLEKAAAGKQADGVILDHLGDAYAQDDQLGKAVETWRRAEVQLKSQEDRARLERIRAKLREHKQNKRT
jgi:tetratricopeptide (TPR) repeat protein